MAQAYRSAQLSYTEMFTADELIVKFDGNTYLLANKGNGEYGSGNLPTSINPIGIIYADGVNTMYVAVNFGGGDHHVVIKSESSSIETTECFKKAVRSVGIEPLIVEVSDGGVLNKTWQQIHDAMPNVVALAHIEHSGTNYDYRSQVLSADSETVSETGVTTYIIHVMMRGGVEFTTADPNGYPFAS